ncbi:MAG: site-specific DNA-methyltransferase, partial [Planctomycetes bacterium]|nr:site-specific DNA-methyltransferase [Planctomycetota bacterium]
KPQLPRFFIERLTAPGELVYDPFLGRGTTLVEAALLGRVGLGCDVNPLSTVFAWPRIEPPLQEEVQQRLQDIDFDAVDEQPDELLVFFHPDTLRRISALRAYLRARRHSGTSDHVDRWIEMVAVNRLTGHSPGFFSVYTLPPNQAVSVRAQAKINARRGQLPEPRDVAALILRKSASLLGGLDAELRARLVACRTHPAAGVVTAPAAATPSIESDSVRLVVTSPPFLDVVQYAHDNWLRCWFCGVDPDGVALSIHRRVEDWRAAMTEVFRELARVLRPGGHVAFEVGEVRGGAIQLEREVVPCGIAAGLSPELILINDQKFTKTANCWGIDNNARGTNTNRVVVFRKPD